VTVEIITVLCACYSHVSNNDMAQRKHNTTMNSGPSFIGSKRRTTCNFYSVSQCCALY